MDDRAVAEVKRLSHAGLAGAELLRRVGPALSPAVPFDVFCAATIDPASTLITGGVAERMDGGQGRRCDDGDAAYFDRAYLDRVFFEEDRGRVAAMFREQRPVSLLSEETGGRLAGSVCYREILEPLGLAPLLSGVLVDQNLWGGLQLLREAGRSDFSPREVAVVRRIAPHLGAGLKAAALRARATEEAGHDRPGVLTLDAAGRVVSFTAEVAPLLLAELGARDPDWRTDPAALPIPVRVATRALDHSLRPATEAEEHLLPRLRVRGRSGRWLTLHAALTEPASARPEERVLIIAPAQPEEIAWLNVAAHDLSDREQEVVRLVVGGQPTKQIAGRLFIAEHTVQRHLSNVFEKVGVRSRRALVKQLFFDQLLPKAGPQRREPSAPATDQAGRSGGRHAGSHPAAAR